MPERSVREARLRPDHAHRYPGIEPGIWFTAATLAEHLDLRRTRERGRERERESERESESDGGPPSGPRPLSSEHFEFRGGEKPVGVREVLGRRPGD